MSYDHLNRLLRIRPDGEYRLEWAKDLSREHGCIQNEKVQLMLKLPLFEVLVWGGIEGVYEAEGIARQRMAA